MSEPTKCVCGHEAWEHGDRLCMGDNLACGCDGFAATPLPAPDPMDEVVGRVERGLAGASDHTTITDSRGDCLNTEGEPIFLDVSDLRKLLAAYQSVREDKARLDWAEYAYLEVKRPTPDNGWEVDAYNCAGYAEAATLREAIDAARRTGGSE